MEMWPRKTKNRKLKEKPLLIHLFIWKILSSDFYDQDADAMQGNEDTSKSSSAFNFPTEYWELKTDLQMKMYSAETTSVG